MKKSFSAEDVLREVEFSLSPGELVGLIGVSGSGKSVLARCLTGLESFSSGEVRVDSIVVRSETHPDDWIFSELRRLVGFVAQNRALPPYRKVLDLVAEGPQYVLGLSKDQARETAERALATLGLSNHFHKYPPELSGGQLTRVCLARASVMRPRYLICDEVTANLDPVRAAEVAQALLDEVEAGIGVLFISHQLEFIREFASRVDYLAGGQIVASGPPSDLLNRPRHPQIVEFLKKAALGR